jgi:hypothetical protein
MYILCTCMYTYRSILYVCGAGSSGPLVCMYVCVCVCVKIGCIHFLLSSLRPMVKTSYFSQCVKRDLEIDLFRSKRDLLTTSRTLQDLLLLACNTHTHTTHTPHTHTHTLSITRASNPPKQTHTYKWSEVMVRAAVGEGGWRCKLRGVCVCVCVCACVFVCI